MITTYETNDVEELKFKQLPNNRIIEKEDYFGRKLQPVQTLAISNIYGLTFISTAYDLRIFSTKNLILMEPNVPKKDKIDIPHLNIRLTYNFDENQTFECVHIGINSDETILCLSIIKLDVDNNNGPYLLFYDIQHLGSLMFIKEKLMPEDNKAFYIYEHHGGNGKFDDLIWNPNNSLTLTFITNTLVKVLLQDTNGNSSYITESIPFNYNKTVASICWSPKGKQLLAGVSITGEILQIKLDFTVAKTIAPPPLGHAECLSIKPINLSWISTYSIMCCYELEMESGDTVYVFVHILTNKDPKVHPTYQICEDPYYDSKMTLQSSRLIGIKRERRLLWLFHITKWKDCVIGISNDDPEIMVICPLDSDSGESEWKVLGIEDVFRAVLPVCEIGKENVEMFPTGAAIDFTTSCDVLFPRNIKYPPSPVLLVMTDMGLLCAFSVVASWPDTPSLNVPGAEVERSFESLRRNLNADPLVRLPQGSNKISIEPDPVSSKSFAATPSSATSMYETKSDSPFIPTFPNGTNNIAQVTTPTTPSHAPNLESRAIATKPVAPSAQFSLGQNSKPDDKLKLTDLVLNRTHETTSVQPQFHQTNTNAPQMQSNLLSGEADTLYREIMGRMDILRHTMVTLKSGNPTKETTLPPFVMIPTYLASEQKTRANLKTQLAELDNTIEKMSHDIEMHGKKRLLDTYSFLEVIKDTFEKGKPPNPTHFQEPPAMYQSFSGNRKSTLASCIAERLILRLNGRYQEICDNVYKLRRKIDLKLEDYAIENINLMKNLKIPDEEMTYRCLKNNAIIIADLKRKFDDLAARCHKLYPNLSLKDLLNRDRNIATSEITDTDDNATLSLILEKIKNANERVGVVDQNYLTNKSRNLHHSTPSIEDVSSVLFERLATLKTRTIDLSKLPSDASNSPPFTCDIDYFLREDKTKESFPTTVDHTVNLNESQKDSSLIQSHRSKADPIPIPTSYIQSRDTIPITPTLLSNTKLVANDDSFYKLSGPSQSNNLNIMGDNKLLSNTAFPTQINGNKPNSNQVTFNKIDSRSSNVDKSTFNMFNTQSKNQAKIMSHGNIESLPKITFPAPDANVINFLHTTISDSTKDSNKAIDQLTESTARSASLLAGSRSLFTHSTPSIDGNHTTGQGKVDIPTTLPPLSFSFNLPSASKPLATTNSTISGSFVTGTTPGGRISLPAPTPVPTLPMFSVLPPFTVNSLVTPGSDPSTAIRFQSEPTFPNIVGVSLTSDAKDILLPSSSLASAVTSGTTVPVLGGTSTVADIGTKPSPVPNFNFSLGGPVTPVKDAPTPSTLAPLPINPFGIKSALSLSTAGAPPTGIFSGSFGFGSATPTESKTIGLFGTPKADFSGPKPFGSSTFGAGSSSQQAQPQSHSFGAAPIFGAASPFGGFGLSPPTQFSSPPTFSGTGAFGQKQPDGTSPSFAALAQMAPSFGSIAAPQPMGNIMGQGQGFGQAQSSAPAFGFGSSTTSQLDLVTNQASTPFFGFGLPTPPTSSVSFGIGIASVAPLPSFGTQPTPAFGAPTNTNL